MKIASWNVNSVKAHLESVLAWLKAAAPDAVALQETKTADEAFPREAFEDLGYNCVVHGQKSYNGVAILSKRPPEDAIRGLAGDGDDAQARYLEAMIPGERTLVRLASIYAPNGHPAGSDKFAYKLEWMKRLKVRAGELLRFEEPVVLAGDYNVIPEDMDYCAPLVETDGALIHPEARAALRRIEHLGFADALRARHPSQVQYSYWDYRGGDWAKNHGRRIDLLLLSPQALDRLTSCAVDSSARGWQRPSDHAPAWCEIAA
jgi:exodeoxyribonuclease III